VAERRTRKNALKQADPKLSAPVRQKGAQKVRMQAEKLTIASIAMISEYHHGNEEDQSGQVAHRL
jgi:hypothetical protein